MDRFPARVDVFHGPTAACEPKICVSCLVNTSRVQ